MINEYFVFYTYFLTEDISHIESVLQIDIYNIITPILFKKQDFHNLKVSFVIYSLLKSFLLHFINIELCFCRFGAIQLLILTWMIRRDKNRYEIMNYDSATSASKRTSFAATTLECKTLEIPSLIINTKTANNIPSCHA